MYSPYVTFVVLTVDRFVGCVDGPLERQKQESRVFRKKMACNGCKDECEK